MLEKYELQHFGHCPRVLCHGSKVIPVGKSDTPGEDTVKLFCPSCLDIYTPPNSRFQQIDGAFFGTTFGYLFFMTFPDLDIGAIRPTSERALALPTTTTTTTTITTTTANGETNSVSDSVNTMNSNAASSVTIVPPASLNGFPTASFAPGLGSGQGGQIYEPRVYGFRVSERSRVGPRMQWLRMKPENIIELDEVTLYQNDEDEHLQLQTVTDTAIDADATPLEDEVQELPLNDDDRNMADADGPLVEPQMRRKTRSSHRKTGGTAGSPMDTNGIGDIR